MCLAQLTLSYFYGAKLQSNSRSLLEIKQSAKAIKEVKQMARFVETLWLVFETDTKQLARESQLGKVLVFTITYV